MSKREITKKHLSTNTANHEQQIPYEITYEAIVDQKTQKLPADIQQQLDELLVDNRREAEKAVPRLLELKQRYPKVPLIHNYLSVAYGFVDLNKQKQAIRENYQQNPKYLFARCHYAQLCLQEQQTDKIPAIFDKKFDLKALYPRRNQFHAGEYAAFAGVLCAYFNAIGDELHAQLIYQDMKKIVPDADETRQAKSLMEPGLFSRIGAKVVSFLTTQR